MTPAIKKIVEEEKEETETIEHMLTVVSVYLEEPDHKRFKDAVDYVESWLEYRSEYVRNAARSAVESRNAELMKKVKEMKAKVHDHDGEAFGYGLLERRGESSCCPGDDAAAGYEAAISDFQKLISDNR